MTGIPHPFSMIQYARERRVEMLAQAERDRLSSLARRPAKPSVAGFAVAVAVMLGVALMLAVSAVLIAEPDQPEALSLVRAADAPAVAVAVAEAHLLDPDAARANTAVWL